MEIEQVWDQMLSRDSVSIQKMYNNLDRREQKSVIMHLKKMAEENGWHIEQKESALIALEVINNSQ